MTEEYYEWLSQLLFSSLWQYEIPDDGDYLYYKWENEYYEWLSQLLFSSLWQYVIYYEIPEDGDYLYYKWEKSIMNDWVSYCF